MFGLRQPVMKMTGTLLRPLALETPAGFKAIHAGHDSVEQNDVGVIWSTIRIAAAPSWRPSPSFRAIKRVGQQAQRFRGIVDDERERHASWFSDIAVQVFRVAMY